jgi:hypothetical protein
MSRRDGVFKRNDWWWIDDTDAEGLRHGSELGTSRNSPDVKTRMERSLAGLTPVRPSSLNGKTVGPDDYSAVRLVRKPPSRTAAEAGETREIRQKIIDCGLVNELRRGYPLGCPRNPEPTLGIPIQS